MSRLALDQRFQQRDCCRRVALLEVLACRSDDRLCVSVLPAQHGYHQGSCQKTQRAGSQLFASHSATLILQKQSQQEKEALRIFFVKRKRVSMPRPPPSHPPLGERRALLKFVPRTSGQKRLTGPLIYRFFQSLDIQYFSEQVAPDLIYWSSDVLGLRSLPYRTGNAELCSKDHPTSRDSIDPRFPVRISPWIDLTRAEGFRGRVGLILINTVTLRPAEPSDDAMRFVLA